MDKGFNHRWKQHPKPQATTEPIFWQKTGWKPEDLKDKIVLDAGCGCGRFSAIAAQHGAKMVCVDSSPEALAATVLNVPGVTVHKVDLLKLTKAVPNLYFDLVFSLGVLHHTADPSAAFAQVAKTVKKGGELAVWVYSCPATDGKTLAAMDFFHDITKAMPPEQLYDIIAKHAVKLRDLYAGSWNPLEQVFRISNSLDNEECVSDIFDWHTPQYRFWHTEAEVRGWFEACGFEVIWTGDFPVSMRGRKK